MFEIVYKPSVEKDRRLPAAIVERVLARVDALRATPFPPQSVKLSGAERLYRLRVSDYRVVYEVESEKDRITVHYVRHRREV